MRILRTIAAVATVGGAMLASSCNSDVTAPKQTTLYIYAPFPNPTVTVRVNGQVLGQLTHQYTGGEDCPSLSHVVTAGSVLSVTAALGQTYSLTWDYGNGNSDADNFTVTSAMLGQVDCLLERIAAP